MKPSRRLPPQDELAELALFQSVDVEELRPLLQNCEVRSIRSGAILIEADQPNDRLYLVLSGELGVHLGSPVSPPIVILGAGETVGELSLIDKGPTSAFVVAHEPTRVLVLSEATMWALVTASHAVSLNLLRTLSTRLRRDNRLIDEHREQLRQVQKLEALGQLTGGIAHDFNNLLALAIVDLEMIAELADDQTRIAQLAEEAHVVLRNGAELTQRLLTFARRQRLEARLVDVNAIVGATGELLCRSLGQEIRLETTLTEDRCQAWVDPAQLQNALLNLAFNARDAMVEGGTLTIATASERATSKCRAARKRVRRGHGRRYRPWHGAGGPGARLRTPVHDQGGRRRHRSRAEHGLRLRQAVGRSRADPQRGRAGDPGDALLARCRRKGGPGRSCVSRSRSQPRDLRGWRPATRSWPAARSERRTDSPGRGST